MSFKTSHDNALTLLRTLFNDLETFASSEAVHQSLKLAFEKGSLGLLDILVEDCESKLKDRKCDRGYLETYNADTVEKLRETLDPRISASSKFTEPALWPLIQKVIIGVRGSRVLERLTLVDLTGEDH